MKNKENLKICFVGSSGGHLTHLYMLKTFFENKDRFWVTFNKEDANSILENEKKYYCYFPTNRNLKNLIKNIFLAIKVLKKERPNLIVAIYVFSCSIKYLEILVAISTDNTLELAESIKEVINSSSITRIHQIIKHVSKMDDDIRQSTNGNI